MKAAFVLKFTPGPYLQEFLQATQCTFVLLCKIGAFTAGMITGDERGVNRVFCLTI